MNNIGDLAVLVNVLPTAARTSTANGTAVNLNTANMLEGEAVLVLDSAAGGGTTPTLDVTIEHSVDGSTGWTAVPGAAFAQVTAAASRQKMSLRVNELRQFVRAVSTITGTSPTFTFSVNLLALPKYPS